MDKVPVTLLKSHRHAPQFHENMGKVIENTISQPLTKLQDVTSPISTIDSRAFGVNQTSNSSYETNWTSFWPIIE